MTTEVKYPETLQQSKDHFESKGYKTLAIEKFSKKPHKLFSHEKLEKGEYSYSVDDCEAIGMVHGPISGTFAIDIDFKNKSHNVLDAIKVLFNDAEKTLEKTLIIKTPKQGVHFIFESEDGFFPAQKKYFNRKYPDIEIDIRSTHGYTLIPPSLHPEKQYGSYSFISNTLTPAKMRWSNVELVLAERGFFTKDEIDNESNYSDYDTSKLLTGGFKRGERRASENSLYCKLRIRGKTKEEAENTIIVINRKLKEPLDEKEVKYNLKYAELFYQNTIVPSLEKQKTITKPKGKFALYELASQLMGEYNFVSHISDEIYYYSNGIYHPNGDKLIKKKSRQYWESMGIETKHIKEIENIIRDKTMVMPEDNVHQDIFDNDYKKFILKNGMFDFDEMEFLDHTHKVLATVKHPIFYNPDTKCPLFDKFLDSCHNGDEKKINLIWEMMALGFIKFGIIQKGFVNYGIGSNGKSTFLKIYGNMIGLQNTTSIPMQQFQKSQFIGYELRGKCVNLSGDGGTDPILKTGFLKSVLGMDQLRCEQKFRSPFEYTAFITLIFTFNELPMVNDSSDGFARKIQTIHWNKQFYGKAADVKIDNLAYNSDERSGIFNKLIPIIKRLLDTRKLTYESTVQETKEVWLSRSDSFFKFKNDHIIIKPEYKIEISKVKDYYKKICEDNGLTPVRDNILFSKLSEMMGGQKPRPSRIDGKPVRIWDGFTIDSELRDDQQESIEKATPAT